MATDYSLIVNNLLSFYDFTGCTVVCVGAGGGQLIDYARNARKIIAIDNNPDAMDRLKKAIPDKNLNCEFEFVLGDFFETSARGDVVLFEFCLHEIDDPVGALTRARSMAPDVVVIDHLPGSEWEYYGAEDEKVCRSWEAIEAAGTERRASFEAVHRFSCYDDLVEKFKSEGEMSLQRIGRFASQRDIAIPMPYGMALIRG
jgi:predicted RNA methylase